MSNRPNARTWAETTRRAEAMDEIIAILARYIPPDSGVSANDALSDIIGVIEVKAGHQFLKLAG